MPITSSGYYLYLWWNCYWLELSMTSSLDFSGQSKSMFYLYFWSTDYKLEVPMTSSLDSINLLEQLKELNKIFYSLDYQFITKDFCSGTPRWKRYTEQCMRKGQVLSCSLLGHHSPQISMCSPILKLSKLSPLEFSWRLHYTGFTDYSFGPWQSNHSPAPSPRSRG